MTGAGPAADDGAAGAGPRAGAEARPGADDAEPDAGAGPVVTGPAPGGHPGAAGAEADGGAVRVAVDLLWLRPGRVGGSETLITRQLAALGEHAGGNVAARLYVLAGFADQHPDLAARFPSDVAPVSGDRRALRVVAESTWLYGRTRRHHAHVLHAAGGTLPLLRGARPVVTIHDLQYLSFPQHFATVKLAWLRWSVPRAVRRAAVVVTASQFVRSTVEELNPVMGGRVVLVPPVIEPPPPAGGSAPVDEPALRRRYGVPGPFVVYPAWTHPHKNHAVLLEAIAALGHRHDEVQVLLPGGEGAAEADVAATIARLGLGSRVRRLGRITAADVDGLYRLATALVFPSRYEGVGLPVLEAMRFGCPVIAADTTGLPETVGGAGLLVPPRQPEAWAAAIADLVDDPAERALLAAAGRERVAAFTPERAADALVAAYRLALT